MRENSRGIISYLEFQSVFLSSELASPVPSPASECVPPPWNQRGGRQHSLSGEGAGVAIRTTGEKACHSVYSGIILGVSLAVLFLGAFILPILLIKASQ
jgi:hypothetical protein